MVESLFQLYSAINQLSDKSNIKRGEFSGLNNLVRGLVGGMFSASTSPIISIAAALTGSNFFSDTGMN